jgi:hypothetical protein
MKVSTFSKCCSATVVEIRERNEPYNLLAIVDYLAGETENEFYAGWYFVPYEIKNRKIDFFIAGKVESKSKGIVEGIRVYVK